MAGSAGHFLRRHSERHKISHLSWIELCSAVTRLSAAIQGAGRIAATGTVGRGWVGASPRFQQLQSPKSPTTVGTYQDLFILCLFEPLLRSEEQRPGPCREKGSCRNALHPPEAPHEQQARDPSLLTPSAQTQLVKPTKPGVNPPTWII